MHILLGLIYWIANRNVVTMNRILEGSYCVHAQVGGCGLQGADRLTTFRFLPQIARYQKSEQVNLNTFFSCSPYYTSKSNGRIKLVPLVVKINKHSINISFRQFLFSWARNWTLDRFIRCKRVDYLLSRPAGSASLWELTITPSRHKCHNWLKSLSDLLGYPNLLAPHLWRLTITPSRHKCQNWLKSPSFYAWLWWLLSKQVSKPNSTREIF